ncbi:MAG: hypothetical protein K6F55_07815 [Eubacterium sp.]|nr:hypothetical protein [Eubacterium sp.]
MRKLQSSKTKIKSRFLAMLLVVICILSAVYSPSMKEVDAAGKKVYVYVLQSKTQGGYKTTYKYNKYGLLVKIGDLTTLKYDSKKRIKKYVNKAATGMIRHNTVTYTYDKKGRIKKMHSDGSHESNTYTYTYSYDKKNRVSKMSIVFDNYPNSLHEEKCVYNNKNQLIEHISGSSTTSYSYDKYGNLARDGSKTYQNSYNKKKCLVKKGYVFNGQYYELTYKYKKIKVDKKYVKKIKKQQWALLNDDVQFLFPQYG